MRDVGLDVGDLFGRLRIGFRFQHGLNYHILIMDGLLRN